MQTPMLRMRDLFNNLRAILPKSFSELSLNHSDPRHIPYRYREDKEQETTKGVKNDFIRIFKDNESEMSFAFAFNNFKENLDDTQVSLTIKNSKGRFVTTKVMSLEDAKIGLRAFNKEYKRTIPQTVTTLFKCLSDVFELKEIKVPTLSFSEEVKVFEMTLWEQEKEYESICTNLQNSIATYRTEQQKINSLVEKYRAELEKTHKMNELKKTMLDEEFKKNAFEETVFKQANKYFVEHNIGLIKSKWCSLKLKSGLKFGYLVNAVMNKYK